MRESGTRWQAAGVEKPLKSTPLNLNVKIMPTTYFKIDQSLNDQGLALERIAPQNQHR